MKRLESVKLVQFLLYEQQEFRFEEITGLFGRNGSGKSSALDAVQIAMMGANKNLMHFNAPVSYTHLTLPTTPYV